MTELMEFIKEYLEEAINNNNYCYYLSHKKMTGYRIVNRPTYSPSDFDITKYLKFSDKFNEYVLEFNDILNSTFSNEYSTLFKKNIKTVKMIDYKLRIIEKMKDLIMDTSYASYDTYTNSIEILKKQKNDTKLKKTVFHELLHLSSSTDLIFSGFSQECLTKKGFTIIGNGLNEGYTEHLNRTYFSDCGNDYSYHDHVQFAAMIEEIVGKEFMMDCYFKNGLEPFLKRFGSIINDEGKAIDLVLDLDSLLSKPNAFIYKDKYNKVRKDLVNYYEISLNNKLNNGVISTEEYNLRKKVNIDDFINGLDYYGFDVEKNNSKKM